MANENKRDYYEVLGLKKDATDADIKRAYRKLAAQYHPDVNHDPGAEEKFKEINEANEVLSDPDKRARYDQYGFAGVDPNFNPNAGGSPFGGAGFGDFGDLGDIFGSFFGGGGRSTRRSASAPMQGDDIGARVELTFEEAAFGAEKEVTVSRVEDCDQCHGSGAAPGTSAETCPRCKGTGSVRTQQNFMGMTMQSTAACPDCRGTGRIIRTPCSRCKGKGKVRRSHKLMVKFPAGIDDGQTLRVRGEGNAGHGGEHLKAGLLLLGGKAVQAHVVFGHTHHGVEGGFLAHTGQGPRHTGGALGIVAHAAAAEHHRTHAFFYDFSSQTVDHGSHLRSARPHGG